MLCSFQFIMLRNFNRIHKLTGGFKSRNEMFRNLNSYTLLNIAADLRGALLENKGAEATNVYGLAFYQRRFYFLKEGLKGYEDVHFGDSCLFCNTADNIC